jgi:ribosomal protein L5
VLRATNLFERDENYTTFASNTMQVPKLEKIVLEIVDELSIEEGIYLIKLEQGIIRF